MSNKLDLLKQIDDAASQYGGVAPSQKSKAESSIAKRTGQMVMGGGSLTGKDLASFDQESKYKHGKTLLGAGMKKETDSQKTDDLRSMKSEYDYGSKKKFVDVLGNVHGKMKDTSGSGLKGLEMLKSHEGNKNLDSASVRSKYSRLSRMSKASRRQRNLTADLGGAEPIPEEDEGAERMLKLVDKDGKTIELSAEQLLLLEQLSQQ